MKSRLRPIYDSAKLRRRLLRIWGRSCSESALILCARASLTLVLLVARCHLPAAGLPFVTWCIKRAFYSAASVETRIILAPVDPPRRGSANGGVVGIDLRGSGDNAGGVLVDLCYVESFVKPWRPRSKYAKRAGFCARTCILRSQSLIGSGWCSGLETTHWGTERVATRGRDKIVPDCRGALVLPFLKWCKRSSSSEHISAF